MLIFAVRIKNECCVYTKALDAYKADGAGKTPEAANGVSQMIPAVARKNEKTKTKMKMKNEKARRRKAVHPRRNL